VVALPVTVRRDVALFQRRLPESIREPAVVENTILPEVREEMVRLVVEARAEVIAVVEAYGKTEGVAPVAVKNEAVGAEVATTAPLAFVERMELMVAPERVRAGTEREVPIETVPVAVRLARERVPEMRPFPWTERIWVGEVVPMPRLPTDVSLIFSFPAPLNWKAMLFPPLLSIVKSALVSCTKLPVAVIPRTLVFEVL